MIYPKNFETKIGFDTIRHEIEARCISPLGVQHCANMHFTRNHDEVLLLLSQTNEFLSLLQSKRDFPLNYYFDLRSVLKSINIPGSFISAENFFKLQRSLGTISEIIHFFDTKDEEESSYPTLRQLARQMNAFPEIASEISRVLDKFGNIKDNASPLLASLRGQLVSLQASISNALRRVIKLGKQEGTLDNDIQPSVRDGRLVIPVSPSNKRKIKGIVHDSSASGKTLFIEPEEVVETNNRIRETEAEIAREIIRILTELTDIIRPHTDELLSTYDILGNIDFIRAKALFAQDVDGQMPNIEKKPHIEWFHAIHPALLLSLREQGKKVVPLNIEINSKNRILLISGPNAGGKSVCLKTVGVVQYMTQCGILPTLHSNSHMGLFNDIFIDIGDQQSIEDDLSTYSSHLQNMKTFLVRGNKSSLILIDEFGSGTEPQIGGAIAQAILEQLNGNRVMGVITTHYHNLKQMADGTPGIINGAMLYDRQKMQPLFELSVGYPGSSFAVEIARKIGLPSSVVDQAQQIVGSDYINMDKYLLDIARDRRYWENKRQDIHARQKKLDILIEDYNNRLDKLSEQQRQIIKDAQNEAREIVRQSNSQVEKTIQEIRTIQAEREKTKEIRRQLDEFKQRLENDDSITESQLLTKLQQSQPRINQKRKKVAKTSFENKSQPLQVGDNVVMSGSTITGNILSIDEKYAIVAFGNVKTRVETNKLQRSNRKIERLSKQSVTASTQADIRSRQLNFKLDIDVRGMRADEAVQAVTYFIDDAIQFSAHRVRILHGTGSGILRDVIRQYLNTVPGVQNYHDEHVQFGGAGITVVNLE
ncbi:MAG: Smr/MutS family protein [Muribaculaceae bacterium]|nr:Smr/MutS family protein [Muribaculaceae bacterium]